MTEYMINDYLKKTQEAYDELRLRGRNELAQYVLRTGSLLAEMCLKAINHINKPLQCSMGHILKGRIAQEAFIKHSVCLFCEHLSNDRYWDEGEMYDPQ